MSRYNQPTKELVQEVFMDPDATERERELAERLQRRIPENHNERGSHGSDT